ncbi:MAG: pyruvate formate lyase-activating protein [Clostridiaceae bacterium]|nr:pyruvate formate lyase-activating protein [Clostridiaceae bacterium]
MSIMGYVHSVETFGTLDGPGIRYIVFLQGCPLRCKYCHNPDTWGCQKGKKMSSTDVFLDILKYKNYIKTGGVTVSGGEPLLQSDFVAELLKLCRDNGIHTCIDTSGIIPVEACKNAINEADLLLMDIKHIDTEKCKEITGQGNENTLAMLEYCQEHNKDIWIRYVLVPGLTDDEEAIKRMAEYLSGFSVIKKIEILPFHKMGEFKWEQLGLQYALGSTREPTKDSINRVRNIFERYGMI